MKVILHILKVDKVDEYLSSSKYSKLRSCLADIKHAMNPFGKPVQGDRSLKNFWAVILTVIDAIV